MTAQKPCLPTCEPASREYKLPAVHAPGCPNAEPAPAPKVVEFDPNCGACKMAALTGKRPQHIHFADPEPVKCVVKDFDTEAEAEAWIKAQEVKPAPKPTVPPTVAPATDEEIAAFTGDIAIYRREHDGKLHCTRCYAESAGHRPGCDHALWPSIKARIEADRAENDRLRARVEEAVEYAQEASAVLDYMSKHLLEVGKCFTLPNGACVGHGCMHDPDLAARAQEKEKRQP